MRIARRLYRARRFTTRSLALAPAAPPWHRGIVMVASIVAGVLIGLATHEAWAVTVAPAFALFLCIADIEGPLVLRLSMLGWSVALVGLGATLAIVLRGDEWLFAAIFLALTYIAGLAAWAGAPFMTATRFAVITGLLLHGASTAPLAMTWALLVAVALAIALARSIESWWAPDTQTGEYASWRIARFKILAARPLLGRYALCYTAAVAVCWSLGRAVDAVHPTWVAVSTLVTMWPDAARSYERILQRFFGTVAGALITLALLQFIHDLVLLTIVALAMAFFLPHFLRRNYWLYSALIVVLVLVAVDVSSKTGFTRHVVAERISDVLLGCVFALVGTFLAFGRAHRLARGASRTRPPA